jgi:hypothetical protein
MGLAELVPSAISVSVGAIMYWAVTFYGHGFHRSAMGLIQMLIRGGTFNVAAINFSESRSSEGTHDTLNRPVTDFMDGSGSVHQQFTRCVAAFGAVRGRYEMPGRVAGLGAANHRRGTHE